MTRDNIRGTISDRGMDHLIPPSSREECEQILERTASVDFSLDTYQRQATKTDIYPRASKLVAHTLGIANEAGEVAGKLKKLMRDEGFDGINLTDEQRDVLIDEVGDVLWYAAMIARDLFVPLSEVADRNLQKLYSRQKRGVLGGSGDNR